MKRKTHEEFLDQIHNLYENKIIVIGEYKNAREKILVRSNECGHDWYVNPNHLLNGSGCPNCAGRARDVESFKDEIKTLTNGGYVLLGEYTTSKNKTLIKHLDCNYEYSVTPTEFISGRRCPRCNGNRHKDTEFFTDEIKNKTNDSFVLIGEYKDSLTKVTINHRVCDYTFNITPKEFIRRLNCPYCCGKKFTEEIFKKKLFELVKDEYQLIGSYQDSANKVGLLHKLCGKIYHVTPKSFMQNTRCSHCNESKGEKRISNYLLDRDFNYIAQFKFKDCKNIRTLPFDFCVFKNQKIFCVIEYDGIQHFEPIEHFGGEDSFGKTREIDEIKNDYCRNNGIQLLRIPYVEFEYIEDVLDDYFEDLNY